MLEVKVNVVVTAPELANAINNIAVAIAPKMQSISAEQAQSDASKAAPVTPAPIAAVPVQATPAQSQTDVVPQVPVQQSVMPVANVPLANAPQFTVDQIMTAGAALMDAGKVDDLLSLLHSFGVQAVMDLKPEQLGAFATEMRKLGAAI